MAQSREEREREGIDNAVLQVIAEKGEVSLVEVSEELNLTEEEVRSSVDRLRKKGEPIEIVPQQGGLWYRLSK